MSITEIVADIRALFEKAESEDHAEFAADLAYLQGYGAALIEHAGHRLPYPAPVSVLEQLLDDTPHAVIASLMLVMSPAARDAMLWPVI